MIPEGERRFTITQLGPGLVQLGSFADGRLSFTCDQTSSLAKHKAEGEAVGSSVDFVGTHGLSWSWRCRTDRQGNEAAQAVVHAGLQVLGGSGGADRRRSIGTMAAELGLHGTMLRK